MRKCGDKKGLGNACIALRSPYVHQYRHVMEWMRNFTVRETVMLGGFALLWLCQNAQQHADA